jgi:hypothetical protein
LYLLLFCWDITGGMGHGAKPPCEEDETLKGSKELDRLTMSVRWGRVVGMAGFTATAGGSLTMVEWLSIPMTRPYHYDTPHGGRATAGVCDAYGYDPQGYAPTGVSTPWIQGFVYGFVGFFGDAVDDFVFEHFFDGFGIGGFQHCL